MIPDNLKYTKEHEWIRVEGDIAVIGITDYAQGELGDIVFIELPQVGSDVEYMKSFGAIEAVKAISDMFSPLTGEVTEVNHQLESDASIINSDPYGDGWILKIKYSDPDELGNLLSNSDYESILSG